MTMQDDSTSNGAKKNATSSDEASAALPNKEEEVVQDSDDAQVRADLKQTTKASSLLQKASLLPRWVNDEVDNPTPDLSGATLAGTKRTKRLNLAKQVAHLHRIRLTAPLEKEDTAVTVPVAASVSSADEDAVTGVPALLARLKLRRKAKKDRLQDWDKWSRFRLWRRTRPLWGSILMLLGSIFLLVPTIYFLPFAYILDSLWVGLFLGALLLVMALIQLFLPTYAVITGSIGIVIALVSFVTSSFGGFGFGMLLGIIGGALSVAWRPVKRTRLVAKSSSSANG